MQFCSSPDAQLEVPCSLCPQLPWDLASDHNVAPIAAVPTELICLQLCVIIRPGTCLEYADSLSLPPLAALVCANRCATFCLMHSHSAVAIAEWQCLNAAMRSGVLRIPSHRPPPPCSRMPAPTASAYRLTSASCRGIRRTEGGIFMKKFINMSAMSARRHVLGENWGRIQAIGPLCPCL